MALVTIIIIAVGLAMDALKENSLWADKTNFE